MDKKSLKKYSEILLEEKKKIITELIQDNHDYDKLSDEEIGDLVDVAYKNYEKDLLFGMNQKEQDKLHLIDSALSRIETNTFGNCIKCNNKIEQKRLEIRPYALKCIECKKREEQAEFGGYVQPPFYPVSSPKKTKKKTTSKKKTVAKKKSVKKAAKTVKKTAKKVTKKTTAKKTAKKKISKTTKNKKVKK